jgi:hypothetical protein
MPLQEFQVFILPEAQGGPCALGKVHQPHLRNRGHLLHNALDQQQVSTFVGDKLRC